MFVGDSGKRERLQQEAHGDTVTSAGGPLIVQDIGDLGRHDLFVDD
jgi:hypothetical protein